MVQETLIWCRGLEMVSEKKLFCHKYRPMLIDEIPRPSIREVSENINISHMIVSFYLKVIMIVKKTG